MKSQCFFGALGVALIWIISSPSAAADIKLLLGTDKPAAISLSGEIIKGDGEKFQSLIKQATTHARVSLVLTLNSAGGLTEEAFKIASTVSDTGVATWVAEGATCASSCFIIFAAGTQKFAEKGARIGTHSVREFVDSIEINSWVTKLMANVLQFYGVPDRIIERALTTAPDKMAWLSKDELHSMGVKLLEPGSRSKVIQGSSSVTSGTVDSDISKPIRRWLSVSPLIAAGALPVANERQPIDSNAVAQRAMLYEENPTPQGTRLVGTVIWQTAPIAPEPGQTPEIAVRADIQIPERRIKMILLIRRETDKSSSVSHTLEIMFNLEADFAFGGIAKVPGALMREAARTRGAPFAGAPSNPASGLFLLALSSADAQRNLQLLRERPWLAVPIVYSNGGRAILAIEKGVMGQQAIDEALANWDKFTRSSQSLLPVSTYEVKVASQRSEAAVKAVYKTLQQKYPNVFGSRQPIIRRANLGDWGIYYRAQVGPFATKDEANQFCTGLKAAGGACFVQTH